MSCAGHPIVRTPNMDRLAAEGTRFANVSTTCPICMPARSSFLSGLYSHNHGQWGNYGHLPAGTDTFALRLQESGYHTCHVGKSHYYVHLRQDHLDNHKSFLAALGWSETYETTGPWATQHTDSIVTDHWKSIGCLDTFRDDYARRREVGWKDATWPSPMPEGETLDDFVGRRAVEYIEGYRGEDPLLMFVGFAGPHEPWDPPADWAAEYNPADMDEPLPITQGPEWLPPEAREHHCKLQNLDSCPTPEQAAAIRALYYAKISHIDSWVGKIRQSLEDRGMLDNTIIILWSDHGEMLCDKGRFAKSVFYEQSLKVPLIIRPPKAAHAGATCDAPVSLVDMFPTIVELAGAEPKPEAFGKSLAGLLRDPETVHHDAVFSEYMDRTMVFDGRYKMVVDAKGQALKLYDLDEDPDESLNLVGREGTDDTIARLRDRLLRWQLATQVRQTGFNLP